ncbi:MAG: flippase-like domain-containing protein [Candidatus Thorarchaeota archaeon]|nr:flippase-like domain-containing protein [Candidatus Thorarchaeota archaeon]
MGSHRRVAASVLIAVFLVSLMILIVGVDRIIGMLFLVTTNPIYLVLFLMAFLGAFLFRAKRLQIIVGEKGIPFKFYLNILFASWFLNVLVPARIGEGAQIALLNAEYKVPVGKAMASVVTDKLFDLLALLLLFSSFLAVIGIDLQQEPTLGGFIIIASIIVLVLFIGLLLIAIIPNRLIYLVNRLFSRWNRLSTILCRLIDSASSAVKDLGSSKSQLAFLFVLSLPIWLCEAATLLMIAGAIGYGFPIIETMTAAIAAFLSMTIPVTPGGFGTYELVMGFILSILVVDAPFETVALPLAITEHLLRQVVTLVVGAISTSVIGTQFGRLLEMARKYRRIETQPNSQESPG